MTCYPALVKITLEVPGLREGLGALRDLLGANLLAIRADLLRVEESVKKLEAKLPEPEPRPLMK